MANNKWHVAPVIRQMEDARASVSNIQALASVGYTETAAAEGVTRPNPVNYPLGANNYFYFGGSRQTPTN